MEKNGEILEILEEKLEKNLKWKHLEERKALPPRLFGKDKKFWNEKLSQSFRVKTIKFKEKNDETENKIQKEIQLFEKISPSEYFPLYYGFLHYSKFKEKKKKLYYSLVFEMENGNLKTLIEKKRKNGLSFQENIVLLECLSMGFLKFEENNIFHENLNPENILYYQKNDEICFKMTDFKNLTRKKFEFEKQIFGAPEYNFCYYNDFKKLREELFTPYTSDVYSIGLVIIFANSFDLPFSKQKKDDESIVYKRSKEKNVNPWQESKGPYDEKIKDVILEISEKFEKEIGIKIFKKIIRKCLKYNPKKRITLQEMRELVLKLKSENFEEKSKKKIEESKNEKSSPKIKEKAKSSKDEQKKNKSEENGEVVIKEEKKCQGCKEASKKNKIFKMDCCSQKFCNICLQENFSDQIQKKKKKTENAENVSFLKCMNKNCKKNIKNEEIMPSILTKAQLTEYESVIKNRKKCKICKKYKVTDKIFSISKCGHDMCKACLGKIVDNPSNSNFSLENNLKCQYKKCDAKISMEDLESFKDLKQKIENLVKEAESNKIIKSQIKNNFSTEETKINQIEQISTVFCKEEENIDKPNLPKMFANGNNEKPIKPILKKRTLYNCKICEGEVPMDDMLTLGCNHRFCKTCLVQDWTTKINEGTISEKQMICPQEKCMKPIKFSILEGNLPKEVFQKYDSLLMNHTISNNSEEVKSNEKCVRCPKCGIEFFIDKKSSSFECKVCKFQYCSNEKCYRLMSEHEKPCEFYFYRQKTVEDEAFEEYIRQNKLKRCPVCDAAIEKTRNCNYIHCSSNKCQKKTIFCYVCGKLLKEKEIAEHFQSGSAFNFCKTILENENKKKLIFCKGCGQNAIQNHMKIVIDDVDCFIACYEKNYREVNYFCILCDRNDKDVMDKASPIAMMKHIFQKHWNRDICDNELNKSIISINNCCGNVEIPYLNEELVKKLKMNLDISSKQFKGFLCGFCGKTLTVHQKILINRKALPVCKTNLPTTLLCEICKQKFSLEDCKGHKCKQNEMSKNNNK